MSKVWMVNRLVNGEYRWEPLSQALIDQIRREASEKDVDRTGTDRRVVESRGHEWKGRNGGDVSG